MVPSFSFKHITVEPSLFLFLIVYGWLKEMDTNLYLYKACQFIRTVEPDLRGNNTCDDRNRGILFVSDVNLKFGFLPVLVSVFISIFATGWSDRAGRKRLPLIYLPLIGIIFHTFFGCVSSFFWKLHPWVAVLTLTICESLGGGIYLMVLGSQLYICDICDLDSRTMRLGLLGVIKLVCQIFGRGGSGFILHHLGFFHSYLLCFILSVLAYVLSLILVKDKSIKVEHDLPFYRMFNFKQVFVDNFKIIFHKRHGIKRIIIVFVIVANISVIFTYFGELSTLYLYLSSRFQWNEYDYGNYLFYKFSTSALGLLFCSIVLSKLLHIHDSLIGFMAGIFDTIAILGLFFANKPWQIYLIPLVDIFHGTAMVIGLSLMTKYYDTSELGHLSAVNGVFSVFSSLCFPAYSITFQKTMKTLPSAFCLLSAVIDVVIVLCFGGAYIMNKKYEKIKSTSTDTTDTPAKTPTDATAPIPKA